MPVQKKTAARDALDPNEERIAFLKACRDPDSATLFVRQAVADLSEQTRLLRERWEALKISTTPVAFSEPPAIFGRNVRTSRLDEWTSEEEHEVLSLDIFDTCLVRITERPPDIFHLVGIQLKELTGLDPEAFASLREVKENELRRAGLESGSREDVPFEDIYGHLAEDLDWGAEIREQAMELEIMTELRYLRPVESVRDRAWSFLKEGGTLAYTSEMYLPAAVLKKFLAASGFPVDGTLILCSGDTGLSKGSGNLFLRLKEAFPGKRLLHVGDNPVSDGEVPRSVGIPAAIIRTPLTTYPDPFSNFLKSIVSSSPDSPKADYWEKIGYTVAGPLHLAFARFILRQCAGIERVFFLSRDGWFPRIAFNEMQDSMNLVVKNDYLYASREILGIASMQEIGDEEWDFILKPSPLLTVSDVFSRLGISTATRDKAIQYAGLPPAGERICHHWGFYDPSIRDRLYHAVCECLPEYLEYREQLRAGYLEYLSEMSVFSGPSLVVDVGWSGSSLKCLQELCLHGGVDPRGTYFALFSDQPQEGATEFFTAGKTREPAISLLKGSVALMEFLFGSPEPTVRGMHRSESGWSPDFRKSWPSGDIQAWVGLEAGIRQFLSDALPHKPTELEGDGRAFLEDVLRRLIYHPQEEDRNHFGMISHSEGWGTENRLRFLPDPDHVQTPGQSLEALCYGPWKPGLSNPERSP